MLWSLHRRRSVLPPGLLSEVSLILLASHLACAVEDESVEERHLEAVDASCAGFEEERVSCSPLLECVTCQPMNCAFGAWTDWSSMGGCIDLCERSRVIAQPNNECGTPCTGVEKETKSCPEAECHLQLSNCVYSAWSAWDATLCGTAMNATEQQRRQKHVVAAAQGLNSIPCTGSVTETKACAVKDLPLDCTLSQWSVWTACTATCDSGSKQRSRTVTVEAAHGGGCPSAPLHVISPCDGLVPCNTDKDCVFGAWSDWGIHQEPYAGNTNQWFRSRAIAIDATNEGKRCLGPMYELKGATRDINDCEFGGWASWTGCTKTCGVGQKSRTRDLLPYTGLGTCPISDLEEMAACNTQVCGVPCQYSVWSDWSVCSALCGLGTRFRHRTVSNTARDCDAVLEEAAACFSSNAACAATALQDCAWSTWTVWGACSLTCGNGTQTRQRGVVTPPGKDGAACAPLSKSEMQTCNLADCGTCTNGVWGDWTVWTSCSQSCDSGFTTRFREEKVKANYCGTPAIGANAEFSNCTGPPCVPNVDCVVSQWLPWGACAPECYGVSIRSRVFANRSSGLGAACTEPLEEMKPCNPGAGQPVPAVCVPRSIEDCALAAWQPWTSCTADCGGLRERNRAFLQLPTRGGKTCNESSMGVLEMCNGTKCIPDICVDCKWSPWREWGDCGMCRGQQTRTRHIEEMPTYCGKPCDERISEETRNCTGDCPQVKFCVFSEWVGDNVTQCNEQPCWQNTFRQTRSMILVDAPVANQPVLAQGASTTLKCNGVEERAGKCAPKSCSDTSDKCLPVDCAFGVWNDWSAPTCSGSVSRQRAIIHAAKCGGHECNGALAESKPAMKIDCDIPFDCQFADWSEWTPCGNDPTAQRTMGREISRMPGNGGQGCSGSMMMTIGCNGNAAPKNCEFAAWEQWSACPVTCGGDVQKRKRLIQQPAETSGALCAGPEEVVQPCNTIECPPALGAKACAWQPWSAWACNGISGQKKRLRSFLHTTPELLIGACVGEFEQIEPCEAVGWVTPAWSEWSACDKLCGGGQKTRTREGIKPPANTRDTTPTMSLPYNESLKEIIDCNQAICPQDASDFVDCALSPWEGWSTCSSSCGLGWRERRRLSFTSMRGKYGDGCKNAMHDIEPCNAPTACPAPVDCKWTDWSAWDACNARCGGGERFRSRSIAEAPLFGGKSCDNFTKEEYEPCHIESCKASGCIDGVWNIWSPWSKCLGNGYAGMADCTTDSAAHGIQKRTRAVKIAANDCGHPVEGATRQIENCSLPLCPSIACKFSGWDEWSVCPGKCDGVKRRHRNITQVGSPDQACAGELVEITNCPQCMEPIPTDCKFGAWFDGECSVSCGGGRYVRTRNIKDEAKNGGAACDGPLKVVSRCNEQVCDTFAPVDCMWGDWQDWGACTKCGPGGERKQERNITQLPLNGGAQCSAGDAERQQQCPDACPKTYCSWGTWQAFGDCTATCGNATKSRRRYLASSTIKPASDMMEHKSDVVAKYAELQVQIARAESSRWKDLSIAFAVGAIGCLVLLVGIRSCTMSRATKASYSRMPLCDDGDRYQGLAQTTFA